MNLNIGWQLKIRNRVLKDTARFPKKDQSKILLAFQKISLSPYSGDIRKIQKEKDVWRRRIGAYRIFYEIFTAGKFIIIFRVERRTSKTY